MMKQIFFSLFFATLAYTAFAQYKVTVSSTSGSYSTSKKVSFNVSWTNRLEGKYNSRVWVLVDYKNLTTGVWSRATVTSVSAGSSGATITAGGRGFWLQGNSGAYSQKVTVTLSGVPDKYNWCAHVSDCPPNITTSGGVYTFKGTPPFTLTAADGTTKQVVYGKTLAIVSLTIAPTALTDATDCPGVFCPYTGNDLYIEDTYLCHQRTSGAKNWEAWIKDERDNKLYRIVYMPDDKWWLAQHLNYRGVTSYCYAGISTYCDTYGALYAYAQAALSDICPHGWHVPNRSEWDSFVVSLGTSSGKKLKATATNNPAFDGTDDFGFTALPAAYYRINEGTSSDLGLATDMWIIPSSTQRDVERLFLNDSNLYVYTFNPDTPYARSIRCVR